MKLPKIIMQNRDQLIDICLQFGVERIYAFGSVLTQKFDNEKSDLDFVVEMEKMPTLVRGEKLIGLWEGLEDLSLKKVDLITDQPLSNSFLRDSIENTKKTDL